MHWDGEQPGHIDWNLVLENLATHFEEARVETHAWPTLIETLHDLAEQLEEFPTLLADCGVDKFVIDQRTVEIERLKRELRATRRV